MKRIKEFRLGRGVCSIFCKPPELFLKAKFSYLCRASIVLRLIQSQTESNRFIAKSRTKNMNGVFQILFNVNHAKKYIT